MLFTPPFVHPGTMFRRQEALDVGAYRSEFAVAQDFDLWTRIARAGRLTNHTETLLLYRVLPSSVSAGNRELQIRNAGNVASRYAASIAPNLSFEDWLPLHRFSALGELPRRHTLLDLALTFQAMGDDFLKRFGHEHNELNNSILAFGTHLRWRCMHAIANGPLRHRWSAARAMRYFDPENGSVVRAMNRGVQCVARSLGFRSKHREVVADGSSVSW
jgi:hypothetical protein